MPLLAKSPESALSHFVTLIQAVLLGLVRAAPRRPDWRRVLADSRQACAADAYHQGLRMNEIVSGG